MISKVPFNPNHSVIVSANRIFLQYYGPVKEILSDQSNLQPYGTVSSIEHISKLSMFNLLSISMH